jgi:hypothetical protein
MRLQCSTLPPPAKVVDSGALLACVARPVPGCWAAQSHGVVFNDDGAAVAHVAVRGWGWWPGCVHGAPHTPAPALRCAACSTRALHLHPRPPSHTRARASAVQGTAATAVGGLYGALRVLGQPPQALSRQRVVCVGAGSAGMGVVRMIAAAMQAQGADGSPAAAAQNFWVLDKDGLVTLQRQGLPPHVARFARPQGEPGALREGASLLDVVRHVQPTVLLGLAGVCVCVCVCALAGAPVGGGGKWCVCVCVPFPCGLPCLPPSLVRMEQGTPRTAADHHRRAVAPSHTQAPASCSRLTCCARWRRAASGPSSSLCPTPPARWSAQPRRRSCTRQVRRRERPRCRCRLPGLQRAVDV